MRNIISPLLFLFIAKASIAQTWKKADAFHNSKDSWIIASTVDDGGSYYVTGGFYDTLNLGNFHLVANDSADVFWAKYNNQGNVVWAKSLGGKGEDNAASILVDREGNLYLLCSFSDTTSIDGNYFVSKGEKDLLLIKCDSLGNVLHYNTWGTVYSDMWTSAFFFDNKIYAIGEYSLYSGSPPKHETIQLDNFSFTSNGNSDILIVEIDTICSIISAKSYGTGISDGSGYICADGNSIYITGIAGATINFDNITLINPAGKTTNFILKLDNNLNPIWIKGGSSFWGYYGGQLATDKSENIYSIGYTVNEQSISFGVNNTNSNYSYIVKYDKNGNLGYSKNLSSYAFYDAPNSLVIDSCNNLYVGGTFNSVMLLAGDTLYSYGHNDMFVLKIDSNGNHLWATIAGGQFDDGCNSIALDDLGDIYIGGYISSAPAYFGNLQASSAGYWDACVAKLSQPVTGILPAPLKNQGFILYPNPADDAVTIEFPEKMYNEISITDISGKQTYRQTLPGNTKSLTLHPALADGFYFIKLTGKERSSVQKLIIKH